MEGLQAAPGKLPRKLAPETAEAADPARPKIDEKDFRWLHNEDAMVSEKLGESAPSPRTA